MSHSHTEIWFVTACQPLVEEADHKLVASNSQKIAEFLSSSVRSPLRAVIKSGIDTEDQLSAIFLEADNTENCVGVVLWLHASSPATWLQGFNTLHKPFLHLHLPFKRDLPWNMIDTLKTLIADRARYFVVS
jgi:L-arabinose isomerase